MSVHGPKSDCTVQRRSHQHVNIPYFQRFKAENLQIKHVHDAAFYQASFPYQVRMSRNNYSLYEEKCQLKHIVNQQQIPRAKIVRQ